MKVAIAIDEFGSVPTPLIYLWKRWEKRGELIDWHVASVYFCKPTCSLDCTQDPPVLGPVEMLSL